MKKDINKTNKVLKFIIMMVLSAIVGVSIGSVGSWFHLAISFIIHARARWVHELWKFNGFEWVPYMVSSMIMVYLAIILVRKFAPEAGGSGVQEIEGILAEKREMHSLRVLFVKFFGGILGLGGGMVMGREGPTIQMGGALGNLVATIMSFNKDDAKMLIAAGAGAGLAVAFNAPIAGMLFVFEEMHENFKFSYTSVPSIMVASALSVLTMYLFMGDYHFISVKFLSAVPVLEQWVFIVYGLLFGFIGLVFNTSLVKFADIFSSYKGITFHIASLMMGAMIGLLLYKWPDTVGDGFGIIRIVLHNSFSLDIILALLIARFFMTMSSYGTSAPGGIFAPMLALGTLFGLGFGIIVNYVLPQYAINPYIFAIVGMSAIFSATVGAPFTGIMLALELTGQYTLVMPILISSLVAHYVADTIGVKPIYTVLLRRTLRIAKFGLQDEK